MVARADSSSWPRRGRGGSGSETSRICSDASRRAARSSFAMANRASTPLRAFSPPAGL